MTPAEAEEVLEVKPPLAPKLPPEATPEVLLLLLEENLDG